MSDKTSIQPWVAVAVSLASVCVNIAIAVHSSALTQQSLETSSEQLATARSAYQTALQQAALATQQAAVAEKSYKLAEQALAFQKANVEQDNRYPVVFNQEYLDAIDSPIANQTQFSLAIINKTKRAFSYGVKVESEGFTVYWPGLTPQRGQSVIYLDRNPRVVSPEVPYTGAFVVWHHLKPSPAAVLRIKVNEEVVLEKRYVYDTGRQAYVLEGG
jgi:hypothetical protein